MHVASETTCPWQTGILAGDPARKFMSLRSVQSPDLRLLGGESSLLLDDLEPLLDVRRFNSFGSVTGGDFGSAGLELSVP